ncbi:hypothetical protein [Lacrimispora defluvii]|uniref:Uncharacterized protein n=1 Tax=Lacrimispora defluvii TaxID=2719233 RepID=A0ABX1W0K1_9FIRM|nr:hypothetical protein [Lacrimispora defluvii]NNJ32033.1 hypothetical protein [Lacrimispora defluvii]
MYDLIKNIATILVYGAIIAVIFNNVKGDEMSLKRKWIVSAILAIFGGILLILTMTLFKYIGDNLSWYLMVFFFAAIFISGVLLLIYCSKLKK